MLSALRSKVAWRNLVIIVFALLATPVGLAQAPECSRVRPSVVPSWTTGGAWASDGSLLLLEPIDGRVLRFESGSQGVGSLLGTLDQSLGSLRPRSMQKLRDGYALKLPRHLFLFLDSAYRVKRTLNVRSKGGFEGFYPFQWQIAGDDLYICGELIPAGQTDWERGIFRIPLANPARYDHLLEVGRFDPLSLYCRLGLPLLAVVDDTLVGLELQEEARLFAVPRGGDLVYLKLLDVESNRPPALPPNPTVDEYSTVMKEIEAAAMPYGVVADDQNFYLINRAPDIGGTRWELARLSVQASPTGKITARVEGRSRIPSHANHLTVIPGAPKWAFVEKGPVQALGSQETTEILFVDHGLIEDMSLSEGGSLCGVTE